MFPKPVKNRVIFYWMMIYTWCFKTTVKGYHKFKYFHIVMLALISTSSSPVKLKGINFLINCAITCNDLLSHFFL